MSYNKAVDFSTLLGKTLIEIERGGDDQLTFRTTDESFVMRHIQDCCENVQIAEIIGSLDDLIGEPILLAEEVVNGQDVTPDGVEPPEYPDSFTWTFYKLRTLTGDVTIRWLGESNGYYSESVDFEKVFGGRDE